MNRVLILTNTHDTSTDWVVRELRSPSIKHLRLNADTLAECTCTFSESSFIYNPSSGPSSELWGTIDVIYLRRPDPRPLAKPGRTADQRALDEYTDSQWRALLRGLQTLPSKWVNPLSSIYLAESKIRQLDVARKIGFFVPDTIITNDPAAVRALLRNIATSFLKHWKHLLSKKSKETFFIYSTLIDSSHLEDSTVDQEIKAAPAIYQKAMLNKSDVRVTVIGKRVLAAEILYEGSDIDWRKVSPGGTLIRQIELPGSVARMCRAMLIELGLTYGAFDFARVDRRYYFLEINPGGEWGWLQFNGLPIASAIVDVLQHI